MEKIQQHIYTRERKGLFRPTEGYDSIAKSNGLEDAFIKENIHPYCTYAPSHRLQNQNADATDYPAAYTVVRCPDGRTLVGRAVYVAADFTGQRSAFFAHHYIIPPGMAFDWLSVAFLDSYDINQGCMLDALDALPIVNRPYVSVPSIVSTPSITKDILISLIHAIFISVSGSAKIYFPVPVETVEMEEYVCSLLAVLRTYLPDDVWNKLGVCTYAREPENKKGIHLIFLEKDGVRGADTRLAKDIVIDINNKQAVENDSPYLKLIYDAYSQLADVRSFYDFAAGYPADDRPGLLLMHWDWMARLYADKNLGKEYWRWRFDFDSITEEQIINLPDSFLQREEAEDFKILNEIVKGIDGIELASLAYPVSLQQKIKEIFQNHIDSRQFDNLIYLFSEDLPGLFSYLHLYGGKYKRNFLIWAHKEEKFDFTNPNQLKIITDFIKLNCKDKNFKKSLYVNPELKALIPKRRWIERIFIV